MAVAKKIAAIVEGHGDESAVRTLIDRIARITPPNYHVDIPYIKRAKRQRIVNPGELEREIEYAARKAGAGSGILILLDADSQCPAELGPELLERARPARSDFDIRVVLAKNAFEAWFLAAVESIDGWRGLRADPPPRDPESGNPKQWLTGSLPDGVTYRPAIDQARLAARFDLEAARERSPSFDKMWRDVQALPAAPE